MGTRAPTLAPPDATRIPNWFIAVVVVLCVAPLPLSWLGVDFSTRSIPLDPNAIPADRNLLLEASFRSLAGSYVHTILEWSAFSVAIITALLSFVHFRVTRDVTVPIIGAALFFSGLMDAFHTIAADRLIEAVADNRQFIPFTWALSRLFNAVVMIAGVTVVLVRGAEPREGDSRLAAGVALTFGVIAYTTIHLCATSVELPQTMYPEAIITRPYDAAPLLLFLVAGFGVYRPLHRKHPGIFTHALLLSVVPEVATETYMAFGSSALFDAWFNVAHALKVLAYLVPMVGLSLDYVRAFPDERAANERAMASQAELRQSEARVQAVLDNIAEGIITIDPAGIIQTLNPAAERLFGYPAEELIGANVRLVLPPPDDNKAEERSLTSSPPGGEAEILGRSREALGQRKDGETFPSELSVSEVRLDGTHLFTLVVRDITERKEVDRLKSEFVSTVSHELRTPLTSIRGSLGLVQGGAVGEVAEGAQEMLTVAVRNTDRLIRLINDILDLEKIEAGRVELVLQTLNPEDLVRAAISSMAATAEEAGVVLVADTGSGAAIRGDRDRLIQVLTNFLSNAVKFSPSGSKVRVRTQVVGQNLEFRVSDEGPGIPESQRSKLFQRFQQLDASDSRAVGGTGLGLAICKAIIEEHGGTIDMVSEQGKGSTFFFTVALASGTDSAKFRTSTGTPDQPLVLLVEDDDDLTTVLAKLLEQESFSIARAATIKEAEVHLARPGRLPKVIVLDVTLPDGNGLDLLARLRERERTADIPVVILSGAEPKAGSFGELRIIDWLTKPTIQDELIAALRRSVGRERPYVLVVEDETRLVISKQLAAAGFECGEAADGPTALESVRARRPDLIVLDVMMPGMDGFEVVNTLREVENCKKTPLLVYTAKDLTAAEQRRLTLGITRHLIKARSTEEQFIAAARTLLNGLLGRSTEKEGASA